MTEPWRICPDCGVGPGGDHKDGCPREKKRHALFHNVDLTTKHPDPRMHLKVSDMPSYPPQRGDGVKTIPDLKESKA
jgi:hypothetical protein